MNLSELDQQQGTNDREKDGFIDYSNIIHVKSKCERVSIEPCSPSFTLHTFSEMDMDEAKI